MTSKRKSNPTANVVRGKRIKMSARMGPSVPDATPAQHTEPSDTRPDTPVNPPPPGRRNKLKPPRPFPTVPASVSATGPRSAHTEGKNRLCITRRTSLGAYMRRCKDVILNDGYKSLHLSAMGAAIPHLVQLSISLPSILPFPAPEIHTELTTGTVDVTDELIPDGDNEDEDISLKTRSKSTLRISIKIGDGDPDDLNAGSVQAEAGRSGESKESKDGKNSTAIRKSKKAKNQPRRVVFQEPEQPDPDGV